MIDIHTQRFRITTTIFLLVTLIVGILAWSIISTARSGQEKRIIAREEVFLDLIALTCRPAFRTQEFHEAQLFADSLTQNPYIGQILLADYRNRIVVGTSLMGLGEELRQSRLPGETWRFRIIADGTGKLGTLAVRFNRDELATATRSMWKLALVLAPAGLLVIVGGSWLMGTLLSRRLERLAKAVREVATGNLDIEIDDRGRDEISEVASAFNMMTSSLRKTLGELRRNEELLQAAVNVSQLGIFDHDHGTDTVYMSPRMREIFGFGTDTPPAFQDFLNLLHPGERERFRDTVRRSHDPAGDGIADVEYRIIRHDGSIRWLRARAQTFFEGEGEAHRPVRSIGVVLDITESRQAEEEIRKLNETLEQRVQERTVQLEAAIRELESFSYSVSHDLQAPLRHINSFSTILTEEYGGQIPEEARHYLNRIARASRHMGQLIDDLLELSRVGRTEMRPETVDLGEMATTLMAMLRETAPQRNVEWEVADGLTARGDRNLLRQALQNLLENAWKYTSKKPGARIEFGKSDREGEEVFFVRDNGAGFDMAYVSKLFSPFQRLHTEREFEGTGIGLATVKRIIERHGGRIWAEGKVDEGATFSFTLPAPPPATPTNSVSKDERLPDR